MLQLYSWIENQINTVVKRNIRKTQIKRSRENTENTQKNTMKTH